MEYPQILIYDRLKKPLESAQERLGEIIEAIRTDTPEPLVHGGLAIAVATLEVALAETLYYYLRHFPQKLPGENFRAALEEPPISRADHAAACADRYVMGLGFKSFEEYMRKFASLLSLSFNGSYHASFQRVQEMKATRNLLLHNDLIVNEMYLGVAGPLRRTETAG